MLTHESTITASKIQKCTLAHYIQHINVRGQRSNYLFQVKESAESIHLSIILILSSEQGVSGVLASDLLLFSTFVVLWGVYVCFNAVQFC